MINKVQDIREYDKKVHKNLQYWATEDEDELKQPSFVLQSQSQNIKKNVNTIQPQKPEIITFQPKREEILIKNEEFKAVKNTKNNYEDQSLNVLKQDLANMYKAYNEEKMKYKKWKKKEKKENFLLTRREKLEEIVEEKENVIKKYKENDKNAEKNQELFEKIKKLQAKLEKSRAETEEVKQFFLLKSEKDDKYIDLLKQEIEKLKSNSTTSSLKKISKN